jgi:hypothetical protein
LQEPDPVDAETAMLGGFSVILFFVLKEKDKTMQFNANGSYKLNANSKLHFTAKLNF